jgi:hypothetical protein
MSDLKDKVGAAKAWYQSKTIIGVVLAFIPTILKLINPELVLDLDGVIEEGFTGAEVIAQTGDQLWSTVVTVGGTLLAIWGRIKAKVVLK